MSDKQLAKAIWLEAWSRGKGVEDMSGHRLETAEAQFERYWRKNHE